MMDAHNIRFDDFDDAIEFACEETQVFSWNDLQYFTYTMMECSCTPSTGYSCSTKYNLDTL